jgi:hypothetical protein
VCENKEMVGCSKETQVKGVAIYGIEGFVIKRKHTDYIKISRVTRTYLTVLFHFYMKGRDTLQQGYGLAMVWTIKRAGMEMQPFVLDSISYENRVNRCII